MVASTATVPNLETVVPKDIKKKTFHRNIAFLSCYRNYSSKTECLVQSRSGSASTRTHTRIIITHHAKNVESFFGIFKEWLSLCH